MSGAQQSHCGSNPALLAGPEPTIDTVAPEQLVNANGSMRLGPDHEMAHFRSTIAPRLIEWARDSRLGINPAYMAALIAKESGFESHAISHVPAFGYAQITHHADADMREIAASAEAWNWVSAEIEGWPRHPAIRTSEATRQEILDLLEGDQLGAWNEYLFDPVTASRAATIWVRMLADIWTADSYPGRYGAFARERLAEGDRLDQGQLLDLVTASYNQGYVYVSELVETWGPAWKDHLNEEAADHLERIRTYTCLFGAG